MSGNYILPENPSQSEATVGKDYLVSVDKGTVTSPDWVLIGGQRNSALNRKADSIDVSHKTSGGWKSSKAGLKSWGIDLSGLVLLNNPGIEVLEQAFDESKGVHLKFQYPDGSYRTGWASITDFSFDVPHDGAATLKGTLEGNGALSSSMKDETPTVAPTTGTFSKATTTDLTFTIDPSTTTVNSVLVSNTALASGTEYVYASGTLKIKATYLATLSNGNVSIVIDAGGTSLTIPVTVTA